jgi:integrase/recombinase XerD
VHYRPILCGRRPPQSTEPPCIGLWVSKADRQMSRNGIYGRVVALTAARLGRRINPHLFRDCAATSIAVEDPDHVQITAGVLGHSSLSTSERHYNHAESLQAARRYQGRIQELRQRRTPSPASTQPNPKAGLKTERGQVHRCSRRERGSELRSCPGAWCRSGASGQG